MSTIICSDNSAASSGGPGDCQLLAGNRRAAWELGQERVADVTQVLDPDFAGKEGVHGQIAKKSKEVDSRQQTRVILAVHAVSDKIEDRFLVSWGTMDIDLLI